MNEHCENGYNILKGLPFPWPVATIVRQHHEKLDGSGYPQGLTENEILIESKIMVVADMFEAMTADRPYRPGMPVETVLELLEAEAGTKLDAEAVRLCASMCRQGQFQHVLTK
jgi:HD-GYP domain-containing protein (c-di-GMP phosphodiesterase class II)